MKLHNTLTQQKEQFIPLVQGKVSMYVCGPTVYDRPHIGNARSVVVYDILFRLLKHLYGAENITYVRNITDVDDKINARAQELGVTIQELTTKTYGEFQEDMRYLNCLSPSHEPKATEHIQDIIELNTKLIDKNHAYVIDNHVYFDITTAKEYGALSGRVLEDMIAGVRIEVSKNKKNPGDFVLWKPASVKDDPSSIFASPWGIGRPGWHIECSAMSNRFLGVDFDIHGGGADLIFPHHTNEIAQSCAAFPNSKFARYWVHNGFLTVDGEKMSKSLGNFLTVQDLVQKGIDGQVMRYLLLSTHYRKPLDFTDKALYDAKESMTYLLRALEQVECYDFAKNNSMNAQFLDYLVDDLNTAAALSIMHEMAKNIHKLTDVQTKQQLASQLYYSGRLLGLFDFEQSSTHVNQSDVTYIERLISDRIDAKKTRDWQRADQIRVELGNLNIELEDKADGTTVWRQKK